MRHVIKHVYVIPEVENALKSLVVIQFNSCQGRICSYGGLGAINMWTPLSVTTNLGYDNYFVF
jgi:hypothetical protein